MKLFVLLLSLFLLLMSCQKTHNQGDLVQHFPAVEKIIDSSKSPADYIINLQIGHSGENCPGCVCVNGKWIHLNCQGRGNLCELQSQITLTQVDENLFSATTTDSTELTDADLFNMPARSLFVELDKNKKEVWLNIPAQLVYRDSATLQFTFNGLYYSDRPVYRND